MITIKLGGYSERERKIISDVMEQSQLAVCTLCTINFPESDCNHKCPYKKFLRDLVRVEEKFRQT